MPAEANSADDVRPWWKRTSVVALGGLALVALSVTGWFVLSTPTWTSPDGVVRLDLGRGWSEVGDASVPGQSSSSGLALKRASSRVSMAVSPGPGADRPSVRESVTHPGCAARPARRVTAGSWSGDLVTWRCPSDDEIVDVVLTLDDGRVMHLETSGPEAEDLALQMLRSAEVREAPEADSTAYAKIGVNSREPGDARTTHR